MAYSLTRHQLSAVRHRIIDTYRSATPEQVRLGRQWYSAAHDIALELDPHDVERAAGVIAALSPRLSWELNVRMARQAYLLGEARGGMGHSCRSATRILRGEHWSDVLRGPKIRAFAASIIDPDTSGVVVIDRHALSIALGRKVSDHEQGRILGRKGAHEVFGDAYRWAAERVFDTPTATQATTWLVWRERTA